MLTAARLPAGRAAAPQRLRRDGAVLRFGERALPGHGQRGTLFGAARPPHTGGCAAAVGAWVGHASRGCC
eukprot:353120-Chlamydomonas_euryale.AAC.5